MQPQRAGQEEGAEEEKESEPAGAMNAGGRVEQSWDHQQQRRKRKDCCCQGGKGECNARAMETGKREGVRGRATSSADLLLVGRIVVDVKAAVVGVR